MTSNRNEKAINSTSFWKKTPTVAVPGRPNMSYTSQSQSRASFLAFANSVSDAWDAQVAGAENNDRIPCPIDRSNRPESSEQVSDSTISERETKNQDESSSISRDHKLLNFMQSDNIDMDRLRSLAWSGLSPNVRSKAWKILCGYLPGSSSRRLEVMERKQAEYNQYVKQYFHTKDQDVHQDTYRQIHIDIPRMSPVVSLFHQRTVQEIFERILYVWAIRHPASGYVQGINDLVTPFFLVFLQDFCAEKKDLCALNLSKELSAEDLLAIEADSYWCLSRVLDGIQDYYTFAQPGIQLKVKQLEELVRRVDSSLHEHLLENEVAYLQFAFRWMNNILMREIPIRAVIRLWDTYLAEKDGFSRFHLYVCAAFLIHWKNDLLKKTDFHTILMFLQNLPTAKWGDAEVEILLAEAFRLSYLFADAPNHLH